MTPSISRRAVFKTSAATTAALLLSSRHAHAAPKFEVLETKVISHQPELYHGWPTLARRKCGQLLLVYSGGWESHVCPFGRVEMMRSDDHGRAWG
jgi:sialidase-1